MAIMLLSHDWSQWFGRNLLGFVVSPKATPRDSSTNGTQLFPAHIRRKVRT
jgi:hypothetical protein